MNIILFGFKMCGKSYYGNLLSKKLKCRFIDTDKLVEDEYLKEAGFRLSCRQIHLEIGNGPFRLLERKVVSRLTLLKDSVISLGGGTILDQRTLRTLKTLGVLVYLNNSKNIIENRVLSKDLPSFLDPLNPKDSFNEVYESRKPIYEKIPAYCLNIEGKTDEEVVDELINVLNKSKADYGS